MLKYLLLSFTLLCSVNNYAATLEGRVVGVTDGDTITVLDASNTQYKIRLSGIDAPEKKQPFGHAAKQSLSDLVYDKAVQVQWHKQDRYQRIVGKVLVQGLDANLEQVKRGLAWHYTKYQKEQPFVDRESYFGAQKLAMTGQLGLWEESEPIAPWDWRKGSR